MTKPDYRALCAELLDELDLWSSWHDATDLKDRAGAALDLTQPEPVAPPSLKERALTLLKAMQSRSNLLHTVHPNIPNGWVANQVEFNLLYRALLALPEPQPVAEGPMPAAELEANEL